MVPKLELPAGLGREFAIPDTTGTGGMTNRESWEREKEHLNAIHALSLAESLKALSTPRARDEVMRTRSRGGRYPSRRSRGSSQELEVDKSVEVSVEMASLLLMGLMEKLVFLIKSTLRITLILNLPSALHQKQ